ncbi:MAG: hypothetical protein K9L88_05205 [Chromatiaceae bacterium]|nr:hypothetical protein [Chromatiaceae bacterium]
MSNTTMVTCRGWWDLADSDLFYPEDLPQDWRLSYFANSFRAALLPAALWTDADPQTAAQWYDDVPPGFRFAAEQSLTPSQATQARRHPLVPAELEQRLGAKLDAWIEPIDESASTTLSTITGSDANRRLRYQRRPTDQRGETDPERSCPSCYGLIAPAELHRDLRRARDWLRKMAEQQGQAPSLIIMARPSSTDLSAWQELLDLLGLG